MKYQKILFATDFSPASQAAFEYATSLARDNGAKLVIVHVEEYPVSYPGGDMFVVHPNAPNPVLRKMLAKIVPSGDVPHEHHLVLGLPADEIVRLADEQHADLIVIGSHGRTGLRRSPDGKCRRVGDAAGQMPGFDGQIRRRAHRGRRRSDKTGRQRVG